MATAQNVKDKINSLIGVGNAKTGKADTTMEAVVNTLISGYGKGEGITPTGTKTITDNGTYDVTSYATASVNVPKGITPTGTKTITTNGSHDVTNFATANVNVPVGITPSGSINITSNGTHNVTNYANAVVNIPIPVGINARIFTSTVSADATSGSPTIAAANDFIASIRSLSNAFVCVRYLGVKASTAMPTFWFNANFTVAYSGATAYNTVSVRQSASAAATTLNVKGLTGENYSGHLCVASNGRLYTYPSTTYPLRAGQYQIIAGTLDML